MQRRVAEGIIIACDFCGEDWDQIKPMIEGHQGSVICLECVKRSLADGTREGERFHCTLCLRDLPPETKRWRFADAPPTANPAAAACASCLKQAAVAFDRDPDVDWKMPPAPGSGAGKTP